MNVTDSDVIIVRGAPGSGKTQISKCLAAYFPNGVRLEIDKLRGMVISMDWVNQDEHIKILSLSTHIVLGFLKLGYKPVIVVDTFSGDKLTKFLAELKALENDLVASAFALVTASDVLKSRIENRSADQFKEIDICERLNSDILKFLLPNEELIDTTALVAEEAAALILGKAPRF
jgi:broad-specificity NMP kinase